jgi:hypothetical protein
MPLFVTYLASASFTVLVVVAPIASVSAVAAMAHILVGLLDITHNSFLLGKLLLARDPVVPRQAGNAFQSIADQFVGIAQPVVVAVWSLAANLLFAKWVIIFFFAAFAFAYMAE